MFWTILLISLALALLAAYTMAMQKTTQSLGRLLVGKTPEDTGPGIQDAITPQSQTARNLIMFALIIIVFGLTTYAYAWYHGLWVVLVCFIGSSIFKVLLGLRPGSPRLVSSVEKNMKLRHQAYLDSGDTLRAQVIEELIKKVEQLSHEEMKREAN
jgi:uncharacterized membrane protein YgcG